MIVNFDNHGKPYIHLSDLSDTSYDFDYDRSYTESFELNVFYILEKGTSYEVVLHLLFKFETYPEVAFGIRTNNHDDLLYLEVRKDLCDVVMQSSELAAEFLPRISLLDCSSDLSDFLYHEATHTVDKQIMSCPEFKAIEELASSSVVTDIFPLDCSFIEKNIEACVDSIVDEMNRRMSTSPQIEIDKIEDHYDEILSAHVEQYKASVISDFKSALIERSKTL